MAISKHTRAAAGRGAKTTKSAATRRKPTAAQVRSAQEFLAGPKGPPRTLQYLQNELKAAQTRFNRGSRPLRDISARIGELEREILEHPETESRAEVRLGNGSAYEEAEPELGAVLSDILRELESVESVTHTVHDALIGGYSDADAAAETLRIPLNSVTEQIGRLTRAIAGARLRGDKLVVIDGKEPS